MRKIISIILLLLLSDFSGFAQKQVVQNMPYIDNRRLHFGFMVGMQFQDLNFNHTGKVTPEGAVWYAEIPDFSPGFSVGLVGDLYLFDDFNLRFTPSMYFGNKTIVLRDNSTAVQISQDIKSNYLIFPFNIRYSSQRLNNYRPYVIAGASIAFDLTNKRDVPIVLKPFDVYAEIGIGCDFYLPYFKLIPELKFSLGLLDILQRNRKDLRDPNILQYTEGFSKLNSKIVSLSFYFE